MFINRHKNQADKASLLPLRNLATHAFGRGVKDYHEGKLTPANIPLSLLNDAQRRITALNGNDTRTVEHTTRKLSEHHVVLVDHKEDGQVVATECFYRTQADNPYQADSLYAKEWQRGFNWAMSQPRRK